MITSNQVKLKLKKNDLVKVISGSNKGKTGKVLAVDPLKNRVKVENVFVVKKHVKPTASDTGGIKAKNSFIHASNVVKIEN